METIYIDSIPSFNQFDVVDISYDWKRKERRCATIEVGTIGAFSFGMGGYRVYKVVENLFDEHTIKLAILHEGNTDFIYPNRYKAGYYKCETFPYSEFLLFGPLSDCRNYLFMTLLVPMD